MKRTCMTCNKPFDGQEWMKQCWSCYIDFKGAKRIAEAKETCGRGFFLISMPDVNEEEMIAWINKRYGKGFNVCPSPSYWDPIRVRPKMELWFICTDDD